MQSDVSSQSLQVPPRLAHRYLVAVATIGKGLMAIPAITGLPAEPFILALVFGATLRSRPPSSRSRMDRASCPHIRPTGVGAEKVASTR